MQRYADCGVHLPIFGAENDQKMPEKTSLVTTGLQKLSALYFGMFSIY